MTVKLANPARAVIAVAVVVANTRKVKSVSAAPMHHVRPSPRIRVNFLAPMVVSS